MPDQNGNETLDERRARLLANGYIDPNAPPQADTATTQPTSDVSNLRSFTSGAEENAGGTLGGLGGMAAGSWLLGPEVGLPATLASAIISSYAGSQIGSGIQHAVEPAEMEQRHQAEEAANPTAAKLGGIADMLVAARPSVGTIKNAFTGAKTIAQSLGNTAATKLEQQAIANIVGGGAVGGAQAIVNPILSKAQSDITGQPDNTPTPSASDVLENVFLGSLFHEPWLAGPMLGMHQSAKEQPSTTPEGGVNVPISRPGYTSPIGPTKPLVSDIDENTGVSTTQPFTKAGSTILAGRELVGQAQDITDANEARSQKLADYQKMKLINDGAIEEPSTVEGHTDSEPEAVGVTVEGNIAPLSKSYVDVPADTSSVTAPEHTLNMDRLALANETEPLTEAERIQQEFDNNNPNNESEQYQKGTPDIDKFANTTLPKIPEGPYKEEFKQAIENWKKDPTKPFQLPTTPPPEIPVEQPTQTISRTGGKVKTKVTPAIDNTPATAGELGEPEFKFPGLDSDTTPNSSMNMSKLVVDYLKKNGFNVTGENANVKLNPDLGHPEGGIAAGKVNTSTRQMELNPNAVETRSGESPVHEVVHQVIEDSLQNPKTQPFMNRILEQVNGSWRAHPESTVVQVGKIVHDNITSGKDAPFFKTLLSNLKLKLGIGNDTDAVNALVEHAQNNAPYSERVGKLKYNTLPAREQFARGSINNPDERVVQSAIRGEDGKIYTGQFHAQAFDKAVDEEGLTDGDKLDKWINNAKQGFLTNKGRFLTREETAAEFKPRGFGSESSIAKSPYSELTSEDMGLGDSQYQKGTPVDTEERRIKDSNRYDYITNRLDQFEPIEGTRTDDPSTTRFKNEGAFERLRKERFNISQKWGGDPATYPQRMRDEAALPAKVPSSDILPLVKANPRGESEGLSEYVARLSRIARGEENGFQTHNFMKGTPIDNDVSDKQQQLLDNFKKGYSDRQVYKDVQVNASPKLGREPVGGYFNPNTKDTVAVPNNTGIALHEATHNLFDKNQKIIDPLIQHYLDNTDANQISKDVRDVGSALATQHKLYNTHFQDLKNGKPTIDAVRNALDELVAQTSSNSFTSEKDLNTAHDFISKVLGEDFHNFVSVENKAPEYYPNFRSESVAKTQDLQSRLNTLIDGVKSDPKSFVQNAEQIKQLSRQIQLIKNQNLGEYYRTGTLEPSGRLPSTNATVNSINLGLDKSEIRGTWKDKLPIILNPFRWGESDITKINNIPAKEGKYIAGKLSLVSTDASDLQGKYRNITDSLVDLNNPQRDLLYRTLLAEDRTQSNLRDSLSGNKKLTKAYDELRGALLLKQQDQISSGELVADYDAAGNKTMRQAEVNPNYMPNIVSSDVYEILSHPGTEVYNKLRDDFIDYQKANRTDQDGNAISDQHAANIFNNFIESVGSSAGKTTGTRFGANRFAEGIGLPDSWIESDPLVAMQRYLRRVTNDMAFYKNVESDPIASRIVGINRDQNGNVNPRQYSDNTDIRDLSLNKDVRNVLDIIQGNVIRSRNQTLEASLNLAKTILLGPVSGFGVHVINVPFTMAKYAAAADMPKIMTDGFANYKSGLQHAYENGFIRKDVQLINDLFVPTTKLANKLYQLRNQIYTINGRRAIEIFGKGMTQAMAESMLEQNLVRAKSGEQQFVSFFNNDLKVGDITNKQVQDKVAANIPQLAKRIGELVQGTYTYKTLPSWAMNSSISPIFQLARWHIEQTNHFYDHVITPARSGNFQPLILATLGSVIGGALIEQLKESVYGKKDYLPTLKEMVASSRGLSGNSGNAAYKLLAMSSFAGYAGMVGEMARSSLDILNKNNPQGYNFPAWGMITDTANKSMEALQAVVNGDADFAPTGVHLVSDILLRNVQLARLANTWLTDNGARQTDTSNKYRDLKVFSKVNGLPTANPDFSSDNPYAREDITQFKHETDVNKVGPELQEIESRLLQQNKDNPAQLRSSLTGLKRNSYDTIPNPQKNPAQMQQYIKYITATQGPEAARALIDDYIRQNAVNKYKSSLVPSLTGR